MSSSESTDTLNQTAPSAETPKRAEAQPIAHDLAPAASELASAKTEAAENYDRYLRAVADLENFRRRTAREQDELRKFAAARVIEDLLPVIDNLGLALAAAKKTGADVKGLVGGVEMVLNQLKSALTSHGLKEIDPTGQAFDANLHESIAAQPSAEVAEGSVINVVRTGFVLNGRLLRPASVVVSSGAPKEAKQS
jgi:molecular chaperone GrpE